MTSLLQHQAYTNLMDPQSTNAGDGSHARTRSASYQSTRSSLNQGRKTVVQRYTELPTSLDPQ